MHWVDVFTESNRNPDSANRIRHKSSRHALLKFTSSVHVCSMLFSVYFCIWLSRYGDTVEENSSVFSLIRGHVGSKTLHQQNPLVVNWSCRLTQVDLYNGRNTGGCLGLVFGIHTHTHTRLTALFPGLPGWASTRKVKPIWILLKQEAVSGSGITGPYASLHLTPDR